MSWQNSSHLWETTDPHRRAFEVLYAERSVQMYRRLERIESPQLDEAKYLLFLEQKCIGCHATPPAGFVAGAKLTHQASPDAYWQGVSCESCHGPAGGWVAAHYAKSWPAHGEADRATATSGFQDTKALATRASICLDCHHGPQFIGQQMYDVNHDLIAAGHPRLNFELHAYLDNLPKHWNEQSSHERQPTSHFETWRSGQLQQRKQQAQLIAARDQGEFANFACLDCHRPIGEPTRRRAVATQPITTVDLSSITAHSTVPERAQLITQFLQKQPNSDEAVQLLLAATAFARDLPAGTLGRELNALQRSLTAQSGKTQYDLPARFDPQDNELQQALNDLEAALRKLPP